MSSRSDWLHNRPLTLSSLHLQSMHHPERSRYVICGDVSRNRKKWQARWSMCSAHCAWPVAPPDSSNMLNCQPQNLESLGWSLMRVPRLKFRTNLPHCCQRSTGQTRHSTYCQSPEHLQQPLRTPQVRQHGELSMTNTCSCPYLKYVSRSMSTTKSTIPTLFVCLHPTSLAFFEISTCQSSRTGVRYYRTPVR